MKTRLTCLVALLTVTGSLTLPPLATAQLPSSLTVDVEGLKSQDGQVCLKLFSASQGFPSDNNNAVQRDCVAIANVAPESSSSSTPLAFSYTFTDISSGTYAVAIYHDQNGDEQLNRGAFGMPTEGYGFSNDAPAVTGPAKYEDAVILVAGASRIRIQLQYPR